MHDQGDAATERKRSGGGLRRLRTGHAAPRTAAHALAIAAATVGDLSAKGGRPRELIDSLTCWSKLYELAELEKRLEALEAMPAQSHTASIPIVPVDYRQAISGLAPIERVEDIPPAEDGVLTIVTEYVDGEKAQALLRAGHGEG